jgi:hypothetical protein
VIALSAIETVAPVALPAEGGIETPPPAATPGESFTPPVMVTRLIDTVGAVTPSPIVTTGPPPVITVAAEPAPASVTLFATRIPPA